MKATFRASMAWLHTWSGLVAGWLLFAIFLTGTLCYFRPEISQWMRPELRPAESLATAASLAASRLESVAPNARRWLIDLPTRRDPAIRVFWSDPGAEPAFGAELLDPTTGLPAVVRETRGGDSLYYFHFDLLMPSIWGRLIVGLAAMVMLVGLVSGVIVHRRIFRDFFTLRLGRGARSWLDAHNVCGVWALPFHLMITYSGLVTLMFLYLPWGLDLAYPDGRQAFREEAGLTASSLPASGVARPLTPLGPVLETARGLWAGIGAGRIEVHHPGDAGARIQLFGSDAESVGFRSRRLLFDGVSGALLAGEGRSGSAAATHGLLYGLHIARFAGLPLRGLFFLCGLLGTGMVATGLLLWAVKRRRRAEAPGPAPFTERLVDALNVGTLAGLPIGIAALFWANRLLPFELAGRAEWEVRCFAAAWIAAALYALLRPAAHAWRAELAAAGVLFAALPLLNAATSDRHLPAALARGDWAFVGFDLLSLAAGLGFGAAVLLLRRRAARPHRRKVEVPTT